MELNTEEEIWKPIPYYEDYEASNLGNVRSIKFGRKVVLKPNKCRNGYFRVSIYVRGVCKRTIQVHQLIAMAFLNHNKLDRNKVVNHIDFNKTNNNINNLEIVSIRENSNKKHLKSSSKYVGVCITKDNKWRSYIFIKRKQIRLGIFDNEELAAEIYLKALNNINLYNGNTKEFKNIIKTI